MNICNRQFHSIVNKITSYSILLDVKLSMLEIRYLEKHKKRLTLHVSINVNIYELTSPLNV